MKRTVDENALVREVKNTQEATTEYGYWGWLRWDNIGSNVNVILRFTMN